MNYENLENQIACDDCQHYWSKNHFYHRASLWFSAPRNNFWKQFRAPYIELSNVLFTSITRVLYTQCNHSLCPVPCGFIIKCHFINVYGCWYEILFWKCFFYFHWKLSWKCYLSHFLTSSYIKTHTAITSQNWY